MDNQANAGADLDKLEAFSDAELNEMEAVACAAPAIWYGTYQIIDGISDEKAVELIEACSPDAIRTLIAQARRALPRVTEQAIPMGAISKTLADAMAVAIENGANSISMPDEYVAVAHFVAYPEQYRTRQAAPEAPTEPEHGLYVAYGDDAAVDLFANAMKAKMAASRAKGRSGWHAPEDCPTERLQGMLIEHLAKGDPVDIGNFAMMLWNRGERVAAPEAPAWDVIALAVDEAEKNGLNYVTTDLLRKLLVRTRAAPATQQAGAGDERPACDMPPDVHQNCGSPNCAMRDYGPGDACKRRATPAATTASASGEVLTEYLKENFALGQAEAEFHSAYIIANKVRATAPSQEAAPAVWYVANGNRVERAHGGLLAQTYLPAEAVFVANALNGFYHATPANRHAQQGATQAPLSGDAAELVERMRDQADCVSKMTGSLLLDAAMMIEYLFKKSRAAQAAHAGADTERLDWLLANTNMNIGFTSTGWAVWDIVTGQTFAMKHKTARDAVDEARAAIASITAQGEKK
jgi:hypothetical protein